MRLSILDGGHFSFKARVMMKLMHLTSGHRAPDVIKLHFYNHAKVGSRMSANFQAAMRGRSDWSVADREMMASFVSKLNQCVF